MLKYSYIRLPPAAQETLSRLPLLLLPPPLPPPRWTQSLPQSPWQGQQGGCGGAGAGAWQICVSLQLWRPPAGAPPTSGMVANEVKLF